MSLPDPAPARKPRRFWLYFPFVLALIGVVALSVFWFSVRARTESELQAAAERLRAQGYEVSWAAQTLDGYPFRINLVLTDARLRDPSGWAVSTPRLEAEAFLHGLGHWVMATPQGLAFTRPEGGQVNVTGQVIRASLTGMDKRPPRFSFEGVKLAFAPSPGARPFALASADKVEIHLRPGPDDQGAFMLRVDGGQGPAGGLFARTSPGKPVGIIADAILSKVSGFKGEGWTRAGRAWSTAGGTITLRQLGVTAGEASLGASAGTLGAGADGRLKGALDVELRNAPAALSALAQTGLVPADAAQAAEVVVAARQSAPGQARVGLVFQAGRTTLGPVALGPAPRLF